MRALRHADTGGGQRAHCRFPGFESPVMDAMVAAQPGGGSILELGYSSVGLDDAWRRRVEGREAWARAVGVRGGRRLALGMASRGVTRVWRGRAVRGAQCMCQ